MTSIDTIPITLPTADRVVDILSRSGELIAHSNGSVGLSGRPLELLRAVDAELQRRAQECEAEEWQFSSLIPRSVLERVQFFEAFPHLGTMALPMHAYEPLNDQAFLTTAACYQLYPAIAARMIPNDRPLVATLAGQCFRCEERGYAPLRRQWAFTMREIVFFGTREQVEEHRQRFMALAMELAQRCQLAANLEPATDSFFAAEARGRALLQKLKGLKYELLVPTKEGDLALASFNHHEDFFGRAFDIRLADGTYAHSGCVAFGLERWVYALVARHGPEVQL